MSEIRKPSRRGGGKPGKPNWSPKPGERPRAGAPKRGPGGSRDRAPDAPRTPRGSVMALLAVQAKRFPDLDIATPNTDGMEARDAALCHFIYDTVGRRWLTLSFLVSMELDKEWREIHPRIQSAMLAGAAQLVFLDKIPAHAAVHESVEWVKLQLGPRAGGLTNAMLRRVAELISPEEGIGFAPRTTWTDKQDELPLSDGGAVALTKHALPNDPMERLAVATSTPIDLLRTWSKSMSMREVKQLALHGLVHPPIILNSAHATAPLPAEVIPHTAPGHHVYTGTHQALGQLLDARKDIWVQDPASALAVLSVADLKPNVVIDLCAGMGTKTRQLAATFPNAKIIATDIDLPRLNELQRVFAGHPQVEVVHFRKVRETWANKADLVVLDVPCSNTGVLARRVEARYRHDRERAESLAGTQRQIIADSIPLLATGRDKGRILYSTCSLDPRENEEQAKWVERWHSMNTQREHRRMPEGGPGEPPERYSDGSYAVLVG